MLVFILGLLVGMLIVRIRFDLLADAAILLVVALRNALRGSGTSARPQEKQAAAPVQLEPRGI